MVCHRRSMVFASSGHTDTRETLDAFPAAPTLVGSPAEDSDAATWRVAEEEVAPYLADLHVCSECEDFSI